MIAVSSETQNAIASTTRQMNATVIVTYLSNGQQVDISNAVQSVTISPDYESRNTTATITLDNVTGQYSPANMNLAINNPSGTYDPLIWPMNRVSIYINVTTPSGTVPIQVFQGVLGDQIDTQSVPGQITIACRDYSKLLQDIYIFLSPYYARMLAEDIIQALLTEYAPWVQFNVQQPSGYLIVQYNQASNTTLWDAIQQIADVMGWRLWFDETGVLQFAPIPTSASTSNVVMDLTTHILAADTLSFSDANIRNDIWVKAESPYTGDIIVANARNQESINMFGERYYEVDRDITAYISTQAQAQQLANAICQRLSFLQSTESVTIPLWPTLEVGDFVTINNSFTGMSSTQYIYLVEHIDHTVSATQKETSLTLTAYTSLIQPSGTCPAAPENLTYQIVPRETASYSGSGYNQDYTIFNYPELMWTIPSTANLYGYTVYRAIPSGTLPVQSGTISASQIPSGTQFFPVADFRAQDSQGNWISSWFDYFPAVPTGIYYLAAYDFAGISCGQSNYLVVNTPPPSSTSPQPSQPPPSKIYSQTLTVWVPALVYANPLPPPQVPWYGSGTTITINAVSEGVPNPEYQFW